MVGELKSLRGLGLTEAPRIERLDAIAHLPLEHLSIDRTKVTDLSPLAKMEPLRRLDMLGVKPVNPGVLAGLVLTYLVFSPELLNPAIVLKIPTLQQVSTDGINWLPIAEFKKKYGLADTP